MIPISSVHFGAEEEELVVSVLRSGLIAQGPMVKRLEDGFAEAFGVKHAVAVNNGTTALVAALQVMDLEPGDEVVTSPFTFVATLNAILEAGATATFADIREDDFNLDPASVEGAITDRTRVLLPVHLYGQMADMDPISELADRHGLRILEDAAQSHGATYRGRPVGDYGLATYSFYATKNMTTGEGGMITTNDDAVADRLRVLRNQGMRERYVYEVAGHNYRLTDLQAAIAIPQLARYADTVARRQENARALQAGLESIPGLAVPRQLEGRSHVWHQFTVRVLEDAPVSRDEFVARLHEAGVGAGIHYPIPLHLQSAWRHLGYARGDLPATEAWSAECLSLPLYPELTEAQQDRVIQVVRGFFDAG